MLKIQDYKNIYFIGIGGISMSSLAEILLNRGYSVAGSDRSPSKVTDGLAQLGIKVHIGHSSQNITTAYDLVVYTAAIPQDNCELVRAKELGIDCVERAVLVGMMMLSYKTPISVAGTHGKTTTSSMVAEILLKADTNPTISIGGMLPSIGGNYRAGGKDYFVLETCEYKDSFLSFNPHSAIILNIDRDHTDYFKTMEHMYNSFNSFCQKLPQQGYLVINKEITVLDKILQGVKAQVVTYGKDSSADWYPQAISYDKMGHGSYTAMHKGEKVAQVQLSVPGEHNIYNSLSALALCTCLGISQEAILKGLASYGGTDRRFQYKGSFNSVSVIDDYAHHPTEIEATIAGARKCSPKSLWVCFQPHTYTRTHDLLDGFAEALSKADRVVLVDIYASREKDTGIVSSKDLADKIVELGGNAIYIGEMEQAKEYLAKNCCPQDMLITMGAGDIVKLGEMLVN